MDDAHLIESIYASIADDDQFAALPALLARRFSAESAWILKQEGATCSVEASAAIDPQMLELYCDHFGSIDPFTARLDVRPRETAVSYERIVPASEYRRTEFFNDFVRANRLGEHVIGVDLPIGDVYLAASLHRSAGGAFEPIDERELQTLVVHLRRLLHTRRALAARTPSGGFAADLFDDDGDAILVCAAGGRIVHRNRAARALPAECCQVDRGGNLAFRSPAAQGRFAAALDAGLRRGAVSAFVVPRPGTLGLRVAASPARAEPAVIVTIVDGERQLRERLRLAQELHGFTPSECALAESLLRGRSLDEHAAARGTALSTVRSQLRAMLEKSNTRRQAELVVALTG